MPVPLGVALPAAAAALAYINARAGVFYDMLLLGSAIPSAVKMAIREKRGRPNLFYLLEDRAKSASTADRTFLLFEDRAYTYAQVYDRALRYGAWLKQVLGIEKGQVVAMDFMNSDTYIFIWMGLWAIGAKPAFINYNLKDQPLVHCVRAARAKILLVDPAVAANVEGVKGHLPGMQIKVVTPQLETEIMAMDAIRYPDELRHEDAAKNMAILIYTSGTTGLPKAAVISWAKLIVAGTFVNSWAGLKASDVYYTCMPMYHSSPTLMCFSAVLSTGCALALGVKFSNRTFWPDVRRHDATVIQYVGETCRYLLAAPPQLDPATGESLDRRHRVHTAFGNGLRPDVWAPFKERFGIETVAEFYGATEGMLATWNLSRNDFSAGAVGRHGWLYDLFMGRDVAFAALDDDAEQALRDPSTGFCRRARAGEPGELLFRLPAADIESRFQGYYGDSAASAAKVMRGVFKRGDAWFRTGDVMRADPARGLLYFHDRIGDTYRWKSENVSTAEVAQGLGTHELVVEANVYGVALPGHDGRAGCAAVALPEGREPDEAGLAALAAHAQASLPRYAVPLFLRFVPPGAHTTGTNKQQKHVLREEGVDPDKTGGDKVFWLQDGRYVPFGRAEWLDLKGGRVKL